MTGSLLPEVVNRAIDANGLAISGAKLYAYATGTTTPQNTYTTSALSVANANPVVADSGGLFPPIYLDPSLTYRFILKDGSGTTIQDLDPVTAAANIAAGSVTGAMIATGAIATALGYTPANDASVLKTGTHSLVIPASALTIRTTNGATAGSNQSTTNLVMCSGLNFDKDTAQFAQVRIPLPKGVSNGSFTARARWMAASGSGNVIWAVQALALSDGDTIDTAFGTAISVTDTLVGAGVEQISPTTAAITASNSLAKQDSLIVQIYRDAANAGDTLSASALLTALELFFTLDASTDA